MKTTRYFDNVVRKRRPYLQDAWLEEAWYKPMYKEVQQGGRTRHYIFIPEFSKYLRVVFEGEMVHNAFLDRGFKPEKH
jgi:hypothetical protein